MYRFNFNLIPEKPKEIVIKEEKRETTSLYFAFLPLLSVSIAIGLMLFNEFVIDTRVSAWEEAELSKENQIQTFRSIVQRHAEFVEKSNLLEPQVIKDVEPERFFRLSQQILEELNNQGVQASINSYKRNSDGSFEIVFGLNDIVNATNLLKVLEEIDEVQTPNTNNLITSEADGSIILTVSFFLIKPEEEEF